MAATGKPGRLAVPCPPGGRWLDICKIFSGVILRGKRATLGRIVPHGIHGGNYTYNTGVTEVSLDSTQDNAAPRSVRDWASRRPLCQYHVEEPFAASEDHPG